MSLTDSMKTARFSRSALLNRRESGRILRRADLSAPVPASAAQVRFWFLSQADGGSAAYTVQSALHMTGAVNPQRLVLALAVVAARHEVLRTVFTAIDGRLFQALSPKADPSFRHSLHPTHAARQIALAAVAETPFDLEHGPLCRLDLLSLNDTDHFLALTLHHAIADGTTLTLIWVQLAETYNRLAAGLDAIQEVNPDTVQFADYTVWELTQRDARGQSLAYWKDRLSDAPPLLELPTKASRPPVQDHSGALLQTQTGADLGVAVTDLALSAGVTANMVFMAAWGLTLAQFSGQSEVVVGQPVSLRNRKELTDVAGPLLNTVAIRLDLDGAQSFADLLGQIRLRSLEALDHQAVPFEQVVEAVAPSRSVAHTPIIQTMLAWHDPANQIAPQFSGAAAVLVMAKRDVAQFDVTLDVHPEAGSFRIVLEYAKALFSPDMVAGFAAQLLDNLRSATADSECKLADMGLSTAAATGLAGPKVDYAPTYFAHDAVANMAAHQPDAVALTCGDASLSYGTLNAEANRLARYLCKTGAGPEARIAIGLPRGVELLVAVLAVLKSGAAYVPLDIDAPQNRLSEMAVGCSPVLVLTNGAGAESLAASGLPLLRMDQGFAAWAELPSDNLSVSDTGITPETAAYVIHTSGTTGKPKGVVVEHRSLNALLAAWSSHYHLGRDHVHLQMAAFSFDVCTADLFRALCFGGRLVVATRDQVIDAASLYNLIKDESVNFADFVPAAVDNLMQHLDRVGGNLEGFRTVICGSDRWSVESARNLRRLAGPDVQIIHAYGVTEATVDSFLYTVPSVSDSITTLPLGEPIANTTAWVLDGQMRPLPFGMVGELYLGGSGVARGYLGRPDLTDERFLPNPHQPGDRLYRSGDRARQTADGTVTLLGRADSQLKLRGYRIEPAEIESELRAAGADQAVVSLQSGRLVAHVTGDADLAALRMALAKRLPDYMLPAAILAVPDLPLTANNKIDRNRLPLASFDQTEVGLALPLDGLETTIARIWAEVLGTPHIGRTAHFFDLGGHSMLAVRVTLLLGAELGLDIRPRDLLQNPVLHDFASHVATQCRPALPPIRAVARETDMPVSFAQQQLWLTTQMQGANAAYNMPEAMRLEGLLNPMHLRQSLDKIVERHESLRTCLIERDGIPRQKILPATLGIGLTETDLIGAPDPTAALFAARQYEASTPFDLAHQAPIRAHLLRLSPDTHVLLITIHHTAGDGWSWGIFWQEMQTHYTALTLGKPSPLPPLDVQYADFAVWQRTCMATEGLVSQEQFWLNHLQGAPTVLNLPTDHPRPNMRDFAGQTIPTAFDTAKSDALAALARSKNGTLLAAVLAAWALVLCRISHQDEVVIGLPTANRSQPQTQGMIGFFVNTLALRINTAMPKTFSDLVAQVVYLLVQAQVNQDLPFEHVVEKLNPDRNPAFSPVFQVMLAWEVDDGGILDLPGLTVTPEVRPHGSAKFDLILALNQRAGMVNGGLEYATALFERSTAETFLAALHAVTDVVVRNPDIALNAIGLLDADAVAFQTATLCRGTPNEGPFIPVTAWFAEQAALTPTAPAVELNGQQMDYTTLDANSNALARRLRANGLCREDRVVICLDRSVDMITTLLAVLKAGGVCLPIDPHLPEERRSFMLRDANPAVIVTEPAFADRFGGDTAVVILTDTSLEAMSNDPICADMPDVVVRPTDLAYILYTSGSTGWPKGVSQTHRTLANIVEWQAELGVEGRPAPQRVLQFASLTFDVAFQEIFTTLCVGAALVLVEDAQRRDLAAMASFLVTKKIDRVFLPFAVLQQLATLEMPPLNGSCEVITAGEAVIATPALRRFLRDLGGEHFYNQFGPTETHVVSQYNLRCDETESWPTHPPIGRPIINTQIYVLDRAGQLLPRGIVGELALGGVNVARGYWNNPALTQEKFIPDPFDNRPGMMLYRSGDLGRYDSNGILHFMGRADRQIKIRGFRIEPAEIEAALMALEGVDDAAVLAQIDARGERALCAYVVSTLSPAQLRIDLKRRLPDHMIPQNWSVLAKMPLNPNGKTDRNALAAMATDTNDDTYVAPDGVTEITLAAIWAQVLRLDKVGRADHFFALGGHSLLAARLIHEIKSQLNVKVMLSDLFLHPVLADFAALIGPTLPVASNLGDVTDIIQPDPANRFEPFPMTDIQQAYWVGRSADMGLGGVSAHAYEELRVRGLDIDRLEAALNRLIARHDMLRTIFRSDGMQQVLKDLPTYYVPVIDLRGESSEVQQARLAETRARLSHHVMDATQWPLFDFTVTVLDDSTAHLHISTDGLIVDAASSDLFAQELAAFYADPTRDLSQVGVTFRDYVLAEQATHDDAAYRQSQSYWQARLATLPNGPELPLARQPETLIQPKFTRRDKIVPKAEWDRLKTQAKAHSVTPSGMLLAAFSLVLAQWSKSNAFTLTLPLYNRRALHPDINRVIGDFTSVLLCEVDVAAAQSFPELCRAVQAQVWRDMDHARVSGVQINRDLSRLRGAQQAPFPVVFNSTLITTDVGLTDDNFKTLLDAEWVHTITQTPQVWIDHTLIESDGALFFNWDSMDSLFPDGMMDAMFASYLNLLDLLREGAGWDQVWGNQQAWPSLPDPDVTEGLLHQLFDAAANTYPENLAVISPDRQISYAQLQFEARSLAVLMLSRGITLAARVAVWMQPGWEQVVATLACHYAGAAYVPLDIAIPTERLANILSRTDTTLVLTQPGQRLPETLSAGIVSLAVVAGIGGQQSDWKNLPTQLPNDIAYIIFTSGSTGEPKGVVIDHGGAVNTVTAINRRVGLAPADRVIALSSLSFDLSVYDIFGTLAVGAALVIPAADRHRDPMHWLNLIEDQKVTVWNTVPSLLTMLVETAEAEHRGIAASMRMAMLSGDWIPLTLPDRFRKLCPDSAVLAMGGATEASIWSIAYDVGTVDPDWSSIPYGKPLPGQGFHVLDAQFGERPVWAVGELYISGRGLALEYWGDPERTNASFISHPVTGQRLYRTGDLGRRLPDGNLEFLGRVDSQVKVQGHRIELGGIEAALESHPTITAAAVRVWGSASGNGEKRLAGYVVSTDPGLSETAVRAYLARHLSTYEIPGQIVFMERLPLSANGKVDRKQLPEPATVAASDDFTPKDAKEAAILAIVCAVLHVVHVGATENLLGLGANSIDILRICNAMSADLGVRPPLAAFMRQPTLAMLIEFWRSNTPLDQPELAADPEAVLEDPTAREAFKKAEHGLRRFEAAPAQVAFPSETLPQSGWEEARAQRLFQATPVSSTTLGRLLGRLARNPDGLPHYQYASAGGLYPVQTYVYLKAGRVKGCTAGAYYYDPARHALTPLQSKATFGPDAYDYFVNRPIFETAAFAVFFVADTTAIRPMYGAQSDAFTQIEAGGMAQHLSLAAPAFGLGLCGIGNAAEEAVAAVFDLGPQHRLIYSMLGGNVAAPAPEDDDFDEFDL